MNSHANVLNIHSLTRYTKNAIKYMSITCRLSTREHNGMMNNEKTRWKFSFYLFFTSIQNSFNKLLLQKEELEQKHVHLLQVVESEKTAKWQYTQQCEELASEIRKLRAEVNWIIQTHVVGIKLFYSFTLLWYCFYSLKLDFYWVKVYL